MFDYFPLSDKNMKFVFWQGILRVFCLDNAINVEFTSLNLLSEDLNLLLLKKNKTKNDRFLAFLIGSRETRPT